MLLREFIRDSLSEISTGVREANSGRKAKSAAQFSIRPAEDRGASGRIGFDVAVVSAARAKEAAAYDVRVVGKVDKDRGEVPVPNPSRVTFEVTVNSEIT
jgi:hypothetical protein